MSGEKHIYRSDTIISEHTNKPFLDGEVPSRENRGHPQFWCGICMFRIRSIRSAIMHMNGKQHKRRTKNKEKEVQNVQNAQDVPQEEKKAEVVKRRRRKKNPNVPASEEPEEAPPAKKMKEEEDVVQSSKVEVKQIKEKTPKVEPEVMKCDDCDLVFHSVVTAISHFKGKRHVKRISDLALKKKAVLPTGQRGRGIQRGGQQGRGRGSGRGYGVRGDVNPLGSILPGDLYDRVRRFTSDNGNYGYNSNSYSAQPNRFSSNTFRGTPGNYNGRQGSNNYSSKELETTQPYGLFY